MPNQGKMRNTFGDYLVLTRQVSLPVKTKFCYSKVRNIDIGLRKSTNTPYCISYNVLV